MARLLVAVLMVGAGCSVPGVERERDTAAEARRDRIAAARAESPLGFVGDDEMDLLDELLQWRAEWDEAYADAVAAISAGAAEDIADAVEELHDEAGDLAAIDVRGVDGTMADWVTDIARGYAAQAEAMDALAAAADESSSRAAQARLASAYDDTVAVELRLLREAAEWVNEDGPATRTRLHAIADAIERETTTSVD